jgi:hypothetical protein
MFFIAALAAGLALLLWLFVQTVRKPSPRPQPARGTAAQPLIGPWAVDGEAKPLPGF